MTLTTDLVREAKQGDQEARNRLFERYLPRILQIVRVQMGDRVRARLESRDLAQDTLLEAVRRLDGFEPRGPGSLLAWLKALARSAVCAESDRRGASKRGAGSEVSLAAACDTSGGLALEPASAATGPLERVQKGEEEGRLARCIAALSEPERDLVVLRNYADQSWDEIARETGRPSPDAARVAYAAAKAKLARLMSEA